MGIRYKKYGTKKRGIAMTVLAILMILGVTLPTLNRRAKSATVDMGLEAYYDKDENAGILSWGTPNKDEPYVYQAYSKKPEDKEFQSISATDLNREVRVLNVYPHNVKNTTYTTWRGEKRTVPISASLEKWMEEPNSTHPKGYGMGLIEVDLVTQDEFNKNTRGTFTNSKGEWDYDVVFFGSTDRHNNEDLTEESRDVVIDFIKTGRGLLYGHDTIDGMGNKNFIFGTLREYGNIKLKYLDNIPDLPLIGSPTVTIRKEGLLTKFPWEIGSIGTNLTVPYTHTGAQIALGDIWMDFTNFEKDSGGRRGPVISDPHTGMGTNNFYLTSWGNTAMIQTGHSAGQATPDEQKVFANTLFYLAQLTKDTSLIDRSAMDVYPPEFVSDKANVVRGDTIKITHPEAKDPIKQYEYYIKATGQDTGKELRSEIVKTDNVSGLVGYSYVFDNKSDTKPNDKVDSTDTQITIPNDRNQPRYVHISAVDYVGNVSDPIHVDLQESFYKVDGNLFMDLDGNGVHTDGEPFIEGHTVSLVDVNGKQVYDLNNKPYTTTTDSKGYYRFDIFKGGQYRLKVEPLEERRFTSVPEDWDGNGIYNQITQPAQGLTDIFEVNNDRTEVTRHAGFTYKELKYTVEHINRDTGNKIALDEDGELDGINALKTTLRPLGNNQIPEGYTYQNKYRVNGGAMQDGSHYELDYFDYTNEMTVTYYYTFNGVGDTTKRFQGDDLESPLPIDSYTNAGIYTKRDSRGNVTDTGLSINASFIIDSYEAPIAIVPQTVTLEIVDDEGHTIHNKNKDLGNNKVILNTSYLDDIQVKSYYGESEEVRSTSEKVALLNLEEDDFHNIDIKDANIKGTKDLRETAIQGTDATLDINEDVNYVGRWVGNDIEIENWTPEGIGGISTRLSNTEEVNRANTIQTSYEMDIYNILEHHYTAKVGSDGVEYYQYTGTTLHQGYYPYNSSGEPISTIRNENTSVIQSTYVDVRDLEVGSYVNADGYSVGNNQITPVHRQVATEVIDNGGQTITGHQTDSVSGGVDAITGNGTSYDNKETGDRAVVNYYEELAYIPYSTEEELLTQQAVPVGGRLYYVDPYDYSVIPSYNQTTVNEESGKYVSEVNDNVDLFYNTGEMQSEFNYTQEHTGVYVSEVDEYDSFEQTIPKATAQNRQAMDEGLRVENEVSVHKDNETDNYQTYKNNARGSLYNTIGEIQESTPLKYRFPITYISNTRELLLKDIVAVGQDSGFPVFSHPETIQEEFNMNYERDIGQEPSITDKLITTNKGSLYLLPINNKGQSLRDEYFVREYIHNIGTSQINLVNDKVYTTNKYLYGRGDNTVYSGQRQELSTSSGSFTADQMIQQDATSKPVTRVNGVRTSNNHNWNQQVLE